MHIRGSLMTHHYGRLEAKDACTQDVSPSLRGSELSTSFFHLLAVCSEATAREGSIESSMHYRHMSPTVLMFFLVNA